MEEKVDSLEGKQIGEADGVSLSGDVNLFIMPINLWIRSALEIRQRG